MPLNPISALNADAKLHKFNVKERKLRKKVNMAKRKFMKLRTKLAKLQDSRPLLTWPED